MTVYAKLPQRPLEIPKEERDKPTLNSATVNPLSRHVLGPSRKVNKYR